MRETLIGWPVAATYGWGIRGQNYFLNWEGMIGSASAELAPDLPPNDPRWPLLRERINLSRGWQQQYLADCLPTHVIGDAVLVPLGNGFDRFPVAFGRDLKGAPTVACPVFEDVALAEKNAHKLHEYDAVVVASRWNQDVLSSFGIDARLCHEGIDPVLFNPSVRKKGNDGKFRVFSGGKAEYRKGHDLVIEAFKLFAEKHDDAVLVACWSSPFGGLASDLAETSVGVPPGYHIGKPNFHAWLQRNGLKPHQFEIVPPRPNWQMADVYGSCDVALFPNRCEGGTNFVAMEAMACGVPTLVRGGFGHDDLPATAAMPRVDVLAGLECAEWGARALAQIYAHPGARKPMGDYWTWERHCREMAEIVENA